MMLVLRRREGQWVEIVHKSGDTLRICVYGINSNTPGRANLAFEDSDRNFAIERPERARAETAIDGQPAPHPANPLRGD